MISCFKCEPLYFRLGDIRMILTVETWWRIFLKIQPLYQWVFVYLISCLWEETCQILPSELSVVMLVIVDSLKCLHNFFYVWFRFFCLVLLTLHFLLSSCPLLPDVCLFQPSCLDDPDREQRIKELELLLMSAESEVQRQVQCRGPRVRTHPSVCLHM